MTIERAVVHRAARYALGALDAVTPGRLGCPTPCAGWDLGMLLAHTGASLVALCEGLECGRVPLFPEAENDVTADPAQFVRSEVLRLVEERGEGPEPRAVAIADHRLPGTVLLDVAALELAVHGWDIHRACGADEPIPPEIAAPLIQHARVLAPAERRNGLFAPPLPVAGTVSDQLVAYLGRSPELRLLDR